MEDLKEEASRQAKEEDKIAIHKEELGDQPLRVTVTHPVEPDRQDTAIVSHIEVEGMVHMSPLQITVSEEEDVPSENGGSTQKQFHTYTLKGHFIKIAVSSPLLNEYIGTKET